MIMEKSRHNVAARNHPQQHISRGDKQVHRHRKLQSFPSDSGSYGSGVADEDSYSMKLGWRSLVGIPMKKLLAEEMSQETEFRRRTPGVIARLMGLDGVPVQQPANKQHKGSSESHLKRTTQVEKTRSSGALYDGRSSRRSSRDQQEFKDVFEVSDRPKVGSSSYSSHGSADLKITNAEMSFIEQKLMDAKCLATYQDFQSSKDFHDTLEFLDSNEDLPLKCFKLPASLFEKHLGDLQATPHQSYLGHLGSSNIEKYEHGDFIWKKDGETKRLNYNRSHRKHHDGYPGHLDRRHAVHSSPKSSKLLCKGRDEPNAVPTRIVVLKPNLGKVQNSTKTLSTPCSSHTFLSEQTKCNEFSHVRFRDIELNQIKQHPSASRPSRKNSLESREIAKEITGQMKNSLCNSSMIFSSSRFRGSAWDDSSCSFSGIESPEESEVIAMPLGNSFDLNNNNRPLSRSSESSVSREAKKRLSERWKMTLKSKQGQAVSRSSTLAEMLAIPGKEMKASNFDSTSSGEGFHDKFASNGKPAGWVEPLGISSSDGWKDGCIGSLPRSKSLPSSSTAFGSPRTILRHKALRDDRFMMPKEALKRERKNAGRCLDQKRSVNNRGSKSGHKKSWSSPSPTVEGDESPADLSASQNKMKINLEENLPNQDVLATESLAETLRDITAVTEDDVDVANKNASRSSEPSLNVLSELSYDLIKDDTSAVDKDNSIPELSVGSSSRSSVSFQQPVPGLESSCCKDADQPSPVSVLEPSFTDDLSSCSDCFESISADLQGLRMQLQLLKLESEEYVEGPMLISSDEDGGEASTGISEDNGLCRTEDSWESSYMIDVLSESGIGGAEPDSFLEVWHSAECPVGLSVFDELEGRYSDWATCPRSKRRLLFDRINSGIVEIHEQFINTHPWVSSATTNIGSKLLRNGLLDCLYRMLGSQGKVEDAALGNVVVSESRWLNLRDDIDVIGREVEKLLLDDLVAEIAG